MIVRVVHVGNDPTESGSGISAVIAEHLAHMPGARSLVSYQSAGRGVLGRSLPALRAAAALVKLNPRDTVVHVHLAQRGSLIREGGLLLLARSRRIPTIATLHGSALLTPSLFSRIGLRVIGTASTVVHLLSEDHHAALAGLVGPASLVVIPNSVVVPTQVPTMAERQPVIVFAGVVNERKGVDVLLRAWRALDHQGWRLACFGPITPAFVARLDRLLPTLDDFELHDPITRPELAEVLRHSRIAVLPSRREALPMFALEALAQGCAVISSAAGSVRALLDGGAGVVVPIADEAALACAISELIADPHRLEQLSLQGRRVVAQRHGGRAIAGQWDAVYRATARQGRAHG